MRQFLILGLLVATGALVLTGCTTTDSAALKRSLYVEEHPELSELHAEAILHGHIVVGMTAEMVTAAWGNPARVEAVEEDDASSRWIYGNHFYGGNITNLFFDTEDILVRYEVNYQPAHANTSASGGDESVTKGKLSGSDVLLSKEGGGGRP